MADERTHADSLRMYHSGAASVDDPQTDPDACLGGNRSSTEFEVLDAVIADPISNLTFLYFAGENETGTGTVIATGDNTLTYEGPDDDVGAAVTITNGQTKILESDDPNKYVRVTRTSATALSGTVTLTLADVLNNVIGFDNVDSDDAAAGITQYRAYFVQNKHLSVAVVGTKVWIKTLGTQRTSNAAQLSSSGAGTVGTSGSFADWPERGWCHIKTSGGTTREIVYYSSRTDTVLTVPATGRARLGTSAAAGSSGDTIDAVPGVRIAIEEPYEGEIQTIADDVTAPTGVSWSTAITEATGLTVGDLDVDEDYGVWIEYEIPEAAVADALVRNVIRHGFQAA